MTVIPFIHLPLLVLDEIFDYIHAPVDLFHLCLVSKLHYDLAAPRLYRKLKFTVKEGEAFSPKLVHCLLLPGHDKKWRRWVRSFEVYEGFEAGVIKTEAGKLGAQLGLALILERIKSGRLVSFRWVGDSGYIETEKPHRVVVDALLKHNSLRSLKLGMHFAEGLSPIFAALKDEHCRHLEKLHVWGIKSTAQMAQVAQITRLINLKHLCLLSSHTPPNNHWQVLPELSGGVSKLVSAKLGGFDLIKNQQQLLGGFFNPSTLRRLELVQCFGEPDLLEELSKLPGIRNLEDLILKDGYRPDRGETSSQQLIGFINACGNLKLLNLRISPFFPGCMQPLMQAVAKNGKSLKVLVLDLCDSEDNQIHWQKTFLTPLRSFNELQVLTIAFQLERMCAYASFATILPKNIHTIHMCFAPEFMRQAVEKTLISDIKDFSSAFMAIYPNQKPPEFLSVGADISTLEFSYSFEIKCVRSDEGILKPWVVRIGN